MFEIEKLKCDTLYCMCNLNGYCVHSKCPMENPDYRMPLEVAKEVEVQMQEQLRIEKELKNLKK